MNFWPFWKKSLKERWGSVDDCPFQFHSLYAVLWLIGYCVAVYAERMRHMMDEARSRPEILERTRINGGHSLTSRKDTDTVHDLK